MTQEQISPLTAPELPSLQIKKKISTIYCLLIAQSVLCCNINQNRLASIGLKGFEDTRSKLNENYLLSINYYF